MMNLEPQMHRAHEQSRTQRSKSRRSRSKRSRGNELSLLAPYHELDADELLAHFRNRRSVMCFPVFDSEAVRRQNIDAVVRNEFRFNGESHQLADAIDWSANPSLDIEWQVMLHKFYYAPCLALAYRQSTDRRYLNKWMVLTDSWIASATANFVPSPAMAPEVTQVMGRRLQNWIYAWHMFMRAAPEGAIPAAFALRWLASVHEQVHFLKQNLSPARNHRTLELYAIFLAGVVLPEYAAADEWRAFSLRELDVNLESDLLADGVHCELSTHYHHLVAHNHLQVTRLARANGIETSVARDGLLERALEFAMHVHKPDGLVPTLSDSDSESYLHLLRLGHELFGREDMLYVASSGAEGRVPSQRSAAFPDAGYYTMRSGWGGDGADFAHERYLVFDCGPIGAGNHGHLDCLSIEVAASGRSLVVDPGRYTYDETSEDRGETNWRAWFRGTAAHNTVTVDGRDQARYERRPGKRRRKIYPPHPACTLHTFASTNGFDLLHGSVTSAEYDAVHERAIFFASPHYWVIFDALRAPTQHRYDLRFQLSETAVDRVSASPDGDAWMVRAPNLCVAHTSSTRSAASIDEGHIAYRYGEKVAAPVLRFTAHGANVDFVTVLHPYDADAPRIRIVQQPVLDPAGGDRRLGCIGVRIDIEQADTHSVDTCLFASSGDASGGAVGGFTTTGRYLLARTWPESNRVRVWAPGDTDSYQPGPGA